MSKIPLLLLALVVVLAAVTTISIAQDETTAESAPPEEVIFQPAEDVTEFTVSGRSALFRLSASTPSGGVISEPKISENVELVRTARIRLVSEQGPLIGSFHREFTFRSKSAGQATIEIRAKAPSVREPIVVKYTVTME